MNSDYEEKSADPVAVKSTEKAAGEKDNVADADARHKKETTDGKSKRFLYFGIAFLVVLIGAVLGFFWWLSAQGHEDTDDSYIEGHITSVSSRVAGTVQQVFKDENQRVKVNELLITLDSRDAKVKVDELKANLDQALKQNEASQEKVAQSDLTGQGDLDQALAAQKAAGAEIEHSKAAYQAALADHKSDLAKINEQRAQLEFSQADFERYRATYAEEAVTQQQYDQAHEKVKVAQAQLQTAIENAELTRRKITQAAADIKQSESNALKSLGQEKSALASGKQKAIDKSQYESQVHSAAAARAQLDAAILQQSYCNISAPVAGKIGRKNVEIGQRVQVGQALMAIVQDDPWVTANFKETQMAKMRVGQKAHIRIDACPGKDFAGHILSFSPASGAKFSVLPADNATGNFTKIVQRVPVKIVFEKDALGDYIDRIAPGMSCVTTVDTK